MLREAAVARYAERSAQLKEQQSQVKHEQGRFAVRQQMKVLCLLNDLSSLLAIHHDLHCLFIYRQSV